jgi:hypothetical protein
MECEDAELSANRMDEDEIGVKSERKEATWI